MITVFFNRLPFFWPGKEPTCPFNNVENVTVHVENAGACILLAIVTCYRKEDNELVNDREEIGELCLLSLGQNTVVG